MTPIDRAEAALEEYGLPYRNYSGLVALIERAIIAAVAEERERLARVALTAADGAIDTAMELVIQAEREECAKIAEDAAPKFYHKRMAEAATCIAGYIRARSEKSA